MNRKGKRSSEPIGPGTKCIMIESDDEAPSDPRIATVALCGAFSLNVFSATGAISCGTAFTIRHLKSHKVVKTTHVGGDYAAKGDTFSIDAATTQPAAVRTLFESAISALNADTKFAITISRFNAALAKDSHADKVIDMSICLESIFSSQTEITYRFSLYNAIIGDSSKETRYQTYTTLKDFYNKRSKVVHGSDEIDAQWFNQTWPTIVKVAKLSLLKKIEFLGDNPANTWQRHLDRVALGMELQG